MIDYVISSRLGNGNELHAEPFGALGQMKHDAQTMALLVVALPFVFL